MRLIKLIKEFAYFISGFALQGVATLLGQLDDRWINIKTLLLVQILFYSLSSLLVSIGIAQVILRSRHRHKRKQNLINKAVDAQKAKSTLELVKNPSKKGELFVLMYHLILEGGRQMKAYFARHGLVQIVTALITIVSAVLGFLSVWMPELAFIYDNLYVVIILIGLTAPVGIFNNGKDLGEQIKANIERIQNIKKINSLIKVAKKEIDKLDTEYAFLKPFLERLHKFNIPLTADQQITYDTYMSQRNILLFQIESNEAAIAKLQEVPK